MSRIAQALANRQGDDSLRQLARDLGVATGTAEGWVKGWRTPELENLPKIAEYLDQPVSVVVSWALMDLEVVAVGEDGDETPIIHGLLKDTPLFADALAA